MSVPVLSSFPSLCKDRETLMQGLHVFERKTKTVIDLESFIPEGHLLRKVDRILEWTFVRELTAASYASGRGRPSIDPEV